MNPLLEAIDLCKTYRTKHVETRAVHRVDLRISEGEFLVIAGASGSGKSTLLSLLGLLESPSSGQIKVQGYDTQSIPDQEQARIRSLYFGFVFQQFNLLPELTVLDNVALGRCFFREESRKLASEHAADALRSVGLQDRSLHYPDQLSGGQQQRAAFARAMVGSPKILFADEPTGNLDSENGDRIMKLLHDAHTNDTAIVLVTHDSRYVDAGTRREFMCDGRLQG